MITKVLGGDRQITLTWASNREQDLKSYRVYRTDKEAVYGAAHRAFDLLVSSCGDQAVRDVFRGVRAGARFADAFKAATGRGLAEFEQNAVRMRFTTTLAPLSGAGGP